MCSYYNYSQTLCIKLLNFNISYPDFMQFHYFVVYPLTWGWKRGLGVKGGPKTWWRQGDFMDIFIRSCFSNCFVCFLKIMFWANLLCMYGNRMHNTLDLGFNLGFKGQAACLAHPSGLGPGISSIFSRPSPGLDLVFFKHGWWISHVGVIGFCGFLLFPSSFHFVLIKFTMGSPTCFK
jgi:hypothetical protein